MMMNRNTCQEILDYFGMNAEYVPERASEGIGGVEGKGYYGSTNSVTGKIPMGDLAFDSYNNLKATYTKEMYTSNKIARGGSPAIFDEYESIDKRLKYYPEEALGFKHAFKNSFLIA